MRTHLPIATLITLTLSSCALAQAQQPTPLTLADALAYAINHNPRLAAAVERVQQARAGVSLADAANDPTFELQASARVQGPLQEIRIPIPPAGRTIALNRVVQADAGVAVAWPLWTGGRVTAAVDAARAQVDATEADLQQATEQLLFEVASGYYGVLRAHSSRAATQAALARAEEDLRTTRATRAAGTATAATLAAAEAAARQAEEAVAAAQTALADAEQTLNHLLGRNLNDLAALAPEPVTIGQPAAPGEAVSVALTTRPELLALAERQDAAKAAIAQAQAERNPALSLVGQAQLQTRTDVLKGHAEFAGLQFTWPIIAYDAPRARERRARAALRELKATEAELRDLIAYQVGEAARRVDDALEEVAATEQALQAAAVAASEARASYEAGAATRQQMVAAASALEQARARRAQADYGLSVAQVTSARALGLLRALFLAPTEEAGA
jgi:outer membrane protein